MIHIIKTNKLDYRGGDSTSMVAVPDYKLMGNLYGTTEQMNALDNLEDGAIFYVLDGTSSGFVPTVTPTLPSTSGTAVFNDAYGGTSSSRSVKWVRYGDMVVVSIYDTQMTTTVGNNNTCVIASGLPKAKYMATSSIMRDGGSSNKYAARVGIDAGSTSLVWWWNAPVSSATWAMSGQLVYIAE